VTSPKENRAARDRAVQQLVLQLQGRSEPVNSETLRPRQAAEPSLNISFEVNSRRTTVSFFADGRLAGISLNNARSGSRRKIALRLDARTVARLTREALAPGFKEKITFDDALSGFGLRLRRAADGGLLRSFVAQYRTTRGRTRRVKLGSAEKVTAAEARKAARKVLARAELGNDPQAEKAAARKKARR
jgi:Arm DNA-binding domain